MDSVVRVGAVTLIYGQHAYCSVDLRAKRKGQHAM